MSARVAVIDTNVLVAGLLTHDARSPVAQIVDGMLFARFSFALSEKLLAEYRAVLLRPRIRERHGLAEAQIDLLLTDLAQNAIIPFARAAVEVAPDPGDQFLWDLLGSHDDLVLVTGDVRLLQAADPPAPVIRPAQFAAERAS